MRKHTETYTTQRGGGKRRYCSERSGCCGVSVAPQVRRGQDSFIAKINPASSLPIACSAEYQLQENTGLLSLRACLDGMVPFPWAHTNNLFLPFDKQINLSVSNQGQRNGCLVEMVDHWRQPFLQVKPFHNGTAATSSFFTKQALRSYGLLGSLSWTELHRRSSRSLGPGV